MATAAVDDTCARPGPAGVTGGPQTAPNKPTDRNVAQRREQRRAARARLEANPGTRILLFTALSCRRSCRRFPFAAGFAMVASASGALVGTLAYMKPGSVAEMMVRQPAAATDAIGLRQGEWLVSTSTETVLVAAASRVVPARAPVVQATAGPNAALVPAYETQATANATRTALAKIQTSPAPLFTLSTSVGGSSTVEVLAAKSVAVVPALEARFFSHNARQPDAHAQSTSLIPSPGPSSAKEREPNTECKRSKPQLQLASVPSVVKAGKRVFWHPNVGYQWFWRGYRGWETDTFSVFSRFVPGKVVLDVGAWIGPTVLWEAHSAKAIVALEPTRVGFMALCANIFANPSSISGRISVVNAALDRDDGIVKITNRGDSTDRFLSTMKIDTRAVSIATLRRKHPVLEQVGFIKIDTEGYERVIVPALRSFFIEKRPDVYVSLHPIYISLEEVRTVVSILQDTFPYLYEVDMRTRFDVHRSSYSAGDHSGTDVLCTWSKL